MRTSYTQFLLMVEFMERNGDLSKPSGGPRGREWSNKKWQELAAKLNSEGTGDSRTEDKWRKVWSDFKNNTKKKLAKINKAARGTGGGLALRVALTDLEERVMALVGEQAATGLAIAEAGFVDLVTIPTADNQPASVVVADDAEIDELYNTDSEVQKTQPYTGDRDWNMPEISSQPTPAPSAPILENVEELPVTPPQQRLPTPPTIHPRKPPPKKYKKNIVTRVERVDSHKNDFLDADKRAMEYERERDRMLFDIEKEKIRQRDMELHLQNMWLEFLKEALIVVKSIMKGKE